MLTGAPGVGKSRLALEVASELRGALADDVFVVELAPLSDPDLVLATVAHALHVGVSGGQPLAARLGRYLRARQILLVLDNFEHVLAAAPRLKGRRNQGFSRLGDSAAHFLARRLLRSIDCNLRSECADYADITTHIAVWPAHATGRRPG